MRLQFEWNFASKAEFHLLVAFFVGSGKSLWPDIWWQHPDCILLARDTVSKSSELQASLESHIDMVQAECLVYGTVSWKSVICEEQTKRPISRSDVSNFLIVFFILRLCFLWENGKVVHPSKFLFLKQELRLRRVILPESYFCGWAYDIYQLNLGLQFPPLASVDHQAQDYN